jgi:hypothetical protein
MGLFDFNANAPPGDPSSYQALEMRRKIALQMLANQRKGYPKNLGEGLTAIGDALAERHAMQLMEGQQAAFDKYTADNKPPDVSTLLNQPPPPTTGPRAEVSDDETITPRPPVVAADDDAEPAPAERTALNSPPPQLSPMQQQAALTPTSQPPAVFPPSPQTATSAPTPVMNDAQSSQMASLMGRPGPSSQPSPFAATASLDSPDTASDAPPSNPLVRDAIARTLVQRTSGPAPPQNPLLATGIVPASFPATPPTGPGSPPDTPSPPQTGIRPAPPEQPGVQVAQAGPAPGIPQINRVTPPVTMPPRQEPAMPANEPMNPAEIYGLQRKIQGARSGNPMMEKEGEAYYQAGKAKREQQDKDNMERYRQLIETYRQRATSQETAERGAPLAQQQLIEQTAKAADAQKVNRFGGAPAYQKFVDDMAEGRKAIQPLANTLPMYDQAKTALKDAYTGSGAEMKLDANKMLRGLGVPGNYSPSVATEILRSRMSAIAAGFVKGTVGSTNISNQDVAFVEKAYSGSIDMEPESLRRLLNIAQEAAVKTVNQHNDRLLGVANDPENDRALRNMYRVPMQYGKDAEILKQQGQDPKIRDYFDQKYGKGHADAVLRGKPYGD